MREAIRQKLLAEVPELSGGVYEPHAAGPDTEKPFAVVVQGEDTEGDAWTGFRRILEVWPNVVHTSFQQVDAIAKKITAVLDKQLIQTDEGQVFSCLYLGAAGSDFLDHEWQTLSRGLRFSVIAIQPVNIPETVIDDPWLDALTNWTESILGQNWHVYRGLWPLGYRYPSVMWRITDFEVNGMSKACFEVRKRFVGHVLGTTPNEQTEAVLQLVERLQNDIKLPLDIALRKYMTVVTPKADLKADAISNGQISFTLTRRVSRPTEEAPLMAGMHFNRNLQ